MVTSIHHISMKCGSREELEKAKDFYVGVLGMGVYREWPDGVLLDCGGGYVEIFSTGAGETRKGAIRHVAFHTDDVDGLADRVREAGYEVFIAPNDRAFASVPAYPFRMAFCRGPLGEEIELFCEQ